MGQLFSFNKNNRNNHERMGAYKRPPCAIFHLMEIIKITMKGWANFSFNGNNKNKDRKRVV